MRKGLLHFLKIDVVFILAIVLFLSTCSRPAPTTPAMQSSQKVIADSPLQLNFEDNYNLKFKSGIRHILEDSQGNTWIASDKEGVCKYNGKSFSYFNYDDGLCSNQIRSIYEHANGEIWFEGGYGLSYYDGENLITPTERNYTTTNVWKYPNDALWFKPDMDTGHSDDEDGIGVYCYDGKTLDYFHFPQDYFENIDSWGLSVSTPFLRAKNGTTWFGTYSAVIGYDGQDFTYMNNDYLKLPDVPNVNNGLHVRAIFEDSKGDLWIGNNGIGILKQEGNQFINFSQIKGLTSTSAVFKGISKESSNLLEHVFAIGEDKQGNMWFGDRDTGAWSYDGKTMKNYSFMDGLTCIHIWHIYLAKNGELWFAMADGNILKFEEGRFVKIF